MSLDYCQFVLLCEGSSDKGLSYVLEALLVEVGYDEVRGESFVWRGTLEEKLSRMVQQQMVADIVFIHRDADRAGRNERVTEIHDAYTAVSWPNGDAPRLVPVVPVTMTEAWLLLDEQAIRSVCGNPRGGETLTLPGVGNVERLADPKQVLFDAFKAVAPRSSRRRITDQQLSDWRARLVSRLDIHGSVASLSAWQMLQKDIAAAWTASRADRG